MFAIRSKSLQLVPLHNKLLKLWHQSGRGALESALGLLPNDWQMSLEIYQETADALENFWLVQTGRYPEYFAWFTNWEIIDISTNKSVGGLGFAGFPDDGQTEIGYLISENDKGKGYATEAVAAIIVWAFKEPKLIKITAQTLVQNIASQRVLLKNDFENMGTVFNNELQCEVFCWEKLRK